jgi:hypothetical protein
VTTKRGDKVLKTKEVPRAWREHALLVRRVNEEITDRYLNHSGVKTVATIGSSKTYGGKSGFNVRVEVDPTNPPTLPAAIDGVSIVQTPAQEVGHGCTNKDWFEPIPGGVAIWGGKNGDGGRGTSGCRVTRDGTDYILTANHVIGGEPCSNDPTGETVYMYTDSNSVSNWGDVPNDGSFWDQSTDHVLVKADRVSVGDRIEDTYDYDVLGHHTRSSLEDKQSSTDFRKQGSTTGPQTGPITALDISDGWAWCIDYDGHGIEFDIKNGEGDSGGPIYEQYQSPIDNNTYNRIAGLYQQWVSNDGTASCGSGVLSYTGRGIAAYRLDNSYNMIF